MKTLLVLLLALMLGGPWGSVVWAAGASGSAAAASASAAASCADCDEDCPPGQALRSGCMSMCAFAPSERIAAAAPVQAAARQRAQVPDDRGLGGLRPRPEPTPPRLPA